MATTKKKPADHRVQRAMNQVELLMRLFGGATDEDPLPVEVVQGALPVLNDIWGTLESLQANPASA